MIPFKIKKKFLIIFFLLLFFSFDSVNSQMGNDSVVKFELKKLVRDNFIKKLEKNGVKISWCYLDKDSYIKALKLKLIEEAKEAADTKTDTELGEELGDLLEVINALSIKTGISQKIQGYRIKKKEEYGSFEKGIYVNHCLVSITNEKQILLFRKSPEKYPEVSKNPPQIYILIGPPGAGKGIFAKAGLNRGYKHISTGDYMRNQVKLGTKIGKTFARAILSGSYLPDSIINQIVKEILEKTLIHNDKIILDGYPRTLNQLAFLNQFLKEHGVFHKVKYVYIDIPLEAAAGRMIYRVSCEKCKVTYNLLNSPPKVVNLCDQCGGKLTQRSTDNKEKVLRRLELFKENVLNVVQKLREEKALYEINGYKVLENSAKEFSR